MNNKKSRGSGRTRNWVFILYPESAPLNWRDVLDGEHIRWIESPLHDRDINETDGEVKKSHYHVLLMFESVKDFSQVKDITDKVNSAVPIKCNGTRGMVRYFAHLDNLEKFQYDKNDIVGHGGADVAEFLKPTLGERYVFIWEMREYVRKNDILEFCDLFDYAAENRFEDWFPLLCDSCAYVMGQFIKSCRNKYFDSLHVQDKRNKN